MTTPEFPQDLRQRWAIGDSVLVADTRSSLVYRVSRNEAASAIVKILKPEGMGELPGMAFLDWRAGHGAVCLLDRIGTACLLEDAGTVILRHHRSEIGDDAATGIIVDVLAELHAPATRPPPVELVPLRQHFRLLFAEAERSSDPALADILRWTAGLADDLVGRQCGIRPLHGDLHHDNIVSGGARGWLAIDPQGLIGDPAYDVANVFGNPLGAVEDILDPARINRLADRFAAAIDCPRDKILRYAAAHAGASICWSLEGKRSAEADENIAERLAFARIVRRMLG